MRCWPGQNIFYIECSSKKHKKIWKVIVNLNFAQSNWLNGRARAWNASAQPNLARFKLEMGLGIPRPGPWTAVQKTTLKTWAQKTRSNFYCLWKRGHKTNETKGLFGINFFFYLMFLFLNMVFSNKNRIKHLFILFSRNRFLEIYFWK